MIEDIELPKWPGLLIIGDSVTKDQAAEILIRTNDWYGFFNNHKNNFLLDEIKKIYKETLPVEELISEIKIDEDIFNNKINKLLLNHLHNDRIDSSWIGGLNGWCNWDGKIFCNNYNIGKYPYVGDVLDDLKLIIKNFPYLNFQLQLLNKEASIEEEASDVRPLVSLEISKGQIKEMDIDYLITPYLSDFDESKENFINLMNSVWRKDEEHKKRIIDAIKKLFLKF